jgi:hypothetical protein
MPALVMGYRTVRDAEGIVVGAIRERLDGSIWWEARRGKGDWTRHETEKDADSYVRSQPTRLAIPCLSETVTGIRELMS